MTLQLELGLIKTSTCSGCCPLTLTQPYSHSGGLKSCAVLEGGKCLPLALGVRARVVQALLSHRRVARHISLLPRHEPHCHQVRADPLWRPKERVHRAHLALQLPKERAHHAIFPQITQPLLLLWGALSLRGVGVCGGVVGGCHHYGSGGGGGL
jgi:hypothetical protein